METQEPIIGAFQPVAVSETPAPDPLLARLKAALAESVDGLDPALIAGDTLEEVERSFAALRSLAATRPTAARVPAGAPGRISNAPATPFEKIREGLSRLAV